MSRAVRWWWVVVGLGGTILGCDDAEVDLEGEACEEVGELNPCREHEFNVCDEVPDRMQWGECHELECTPGEEKPCGEIGGTATCEVVDGIPQWVCVDGTPLVLSFDGRDPVLSDAASAAAFDVGTAGACIQTDWPSVDTPWLALDRDRSGSIDGGHELFGSGTMLRDGKRAHNGFMALRQLDSNGDGRISASDERFEELVLWSDHDRDKRSTHAEHEPLSTRGIVAIELDWHARRACDERGNCGIERAAFTFLDARSRAQVGQVIDVHLPCR